MAGQSMHVRGAYLRSPPQLRFLCTIFSMIPTQFQLKGPLQNQPHQPHRCHQADGPQDRLVQVTAHRRHTTSYRHGPSNTNMAHRQHQGCKIKSVRRPRTHAEL